MQILRHFECEEDEPCVTIAIRYNLNGKSVEEEIKNDGKECDEDDISVETMGVMTQN